MAGAGGFEAEGGGVEGVVGCGRWSWGAGDGGGSEERCVFVGQRGRRESIVFCGGDESGGVVVALVVVIVVV